MTSARRPAAALIVTTVPATFLAFIVPHARELVRRGWDVTVATGTVAPGERVADLPTVALSTSRSAKDVVAHLRSLRELRRLMGSGRFDLVYVHSPIAAALVRLAGLALRRPPAVVYFAHGFHFLARSERTRSQWVWYAVERPSRTGRTGCSWSTAPTRTRCAAGPSRARTACSG